MFHQRRTTKSPGDDNDYIHAAHAMKRWYGMHMHAPRLHYVSAHMHVEVVVGVHSIHVNDGDNDEGSSLP